MELCSLVLESNNVLLLEWNNAFLTFTNWITCNKLKSNSNESGFLIFQFKYTPMSTWPSITVGNEIFEPKDKVYVTLT